MFGMKCMLAMNGKAGNDPRNKNVSFELWGEVNTFTVLHGTFFGVLTRWQSIKCKPPPVCSSARGRNYLD